jgi:hypothetical protein
MSSVFGSNVCFAQRRLNEERPVKNWNMSCSDEYEVGCARTGGNRDETT